MMRVLKAIFVVWGVVSGAGAVFAWIWVRERYGRGGPIPPSQAFMLLSPQRSLLHPVDEMVRSFRVREGDTVLELGPGPGYFSIEASRAVGPRGRVLCVDVQPGMVSILRERLDEARAVNARPVVGDGVRLPLRDGCIDAAYLVTVLGEIPDRPKAMAELRRVMKPGGVLSIMESLGDPDYQLEASVRDLCEAYGFSVLELRRQRLGYTLSFSAPGAA
jgi:SAM-dependent methyltransferase